jgi:hypothetical protein
MTQLATTKTAKRSRGWAAIFLSLALSLAACAASAPAPAPAPRLFDFHSNFWLNLHHFARAAGRGLPAPAELTADERAAWDKGVAFYREHYSDRDLLFDDGMVRIKETLRVLGEDAPLDGAGVDGDLQAILTEMAPIYRAHWWPAHDAANRAWIASVEPLLRAHGARLSQKVAAAYGVAWPSTPIPVDLAVTAGPNGAYTTTRPGTHVTIAASDPGCQGLAALETLFHESSHAWGTLLQEAIAQAEAARHKTVPRRLWHAVLFYNAGELTRRTLAEDGVPGYVEHAVVHQVYPALCGEGCRERVVAAWNPHLAGTTSLEQALDGLVAAWPAP